MAFEKLVEVIHSSVDAGWKDRNEAALASLFGSAEGRYPQAASGEIALRAPAMGGETGVPFAAYIHPSNPPSGAYSGLSFVIFPADGAPCLLGLVVGTQGLTPDEAILGRPGHARKTKAICGWLNRRYGKGGRVAWAKQDLRGPTFRFQMKSRKSGPATRPPLIAMAKRSTRYFDRRPTKRRQRLR